MEKFISKRTARVQSRLVVWKKLVGRINGPALGLVLWSTGRVRHFEDDYVNWNSYEIKGNTNTRKMEAEFDQQVKILNTGKFPDNRDILTKSEAYNSKICISSYGPGIYSINLWYARPIRE